MDAYRLIVPLGIVTYGTLWMSVLSGTRKIKVNFRWHRRFGLIGISVATAHAALAFYYGFF